MTKTLLLMDGSGPANDGVANAPEKAPMEMQVDGGKPMPPSLVKPHVQKKQRKGDRNNLKAGSVSERHPEQ
jgi:hypothetical protein